MPELSGGFAQVNGVRLHYESAGSGRLVVFLHGFPEFWRCWEKQLLDLGRDYHAIAPDMRGYNLSDCPPDVRDYRAKLLVEDIRQFARTFTQDKFVLVAHDWGGAVAWTLAQAHPELLSHLVIINSPHPYLFWRDLSTNPAQQKASEYMLLLRNPKAERVLSENNFERLLKMRFADRPPGPALEADKAAYVQAWSQPGALTGNLNYYRASPLYPPAADDAGAGKLKLEAKDFVVKVPTLVIWGEKDRALLPAMLEGIDEVVPGVEVVRVPDATHWVMDEKPDLVNSEIRKFISKGQS